MIDLKYHTQLSDTDIVQRILLGEKALYEILVRRNNPFLYKIGRSYGYNHEDAQDLMQETFVNAYMNLAAFQNRASFKTWIIKIMLNQCYHKKQKLNYKNTILTDTNFTDNAMPLFISHIDTDKTVVRRELGHVIEEAIAQIPEDYRMVFSLREINGMSVSETAEALEISEANVKTRLNRAKNMLRKEVEKIYSAEEIFEFNLVYCDKIVANVMNEINKL
jgi:RNA polymerase sigma-70 factor (ECF subfamily)